jgi:hypothetical protein
VALHQVAMSCKVSSHMTESCSAPSSACYIVDTRDSTLGGIKNPREDSLHTMETPNCAATHSAAVRHEARVSPKVRHYFEPNICIYFGPFLPPFMFCTEPMYHMSQSPPEF